MSTRRDQILATAATLFAERGFHGVSVDELGAACGISGPALYKHFPSKDAMLAEMLVAISEKLLSVAVERASSAQDPVRAVVALVGWHVDFALHHQPLIVVQDRDWASLPDQDRERVRDLQRRYVRLWADWLCRADAGLTTTRAQAMAHATFGLLNSTPHSAVLPEPDMSTMLEQMALRALGVRRAPAHHGDDRPPTERRRALA